MQLALSDDYDRADELLSDDDGGRASSASSPPRTSESVPPDVLRNSKILQVCSPPAYTSFLISSGDIPASIPPRSDDIFEPSCGSSTEIVRR